MGKRYPIDLVIRDVAHAAYAEWLKGIGFRRAKLIWRRRVGDAVQLVIVRPARRGAGPDGEVSLAVGVYFPALAASLGLSPPSEEPGEWHCHLHARPLPVGTRSWPVRAVGVRDPLEASMGGMFGAVLAWLSRRADAKAAARNARATAGLRTALEQTGLPWLERMADLSTARDALQRSDLHWHAAAASLLLGERDEAARLYRLACRLKSGDGADYRDGWAAANGIG